MLRFLDKVRIKAQSNLIAMVNQQAEQFFDGHEGVVVGQKADAKYVVWFPNNGGFPNLSSDAFPEASLIYLGSAVPIDPGFKPDVIPDSGKKMAEKQSIASAIASIKPWEFMGLERDPIPKMPEIKFP